MVLGWFIIGFRVYGFGDGLGFRGGKFGVEAALGKDW